MNPTWVELPISMLLLNKKLTGWRAVTIASPSEELSGVTSCLNLIDEGVQIISPETLAESVPAVIHPDCLMVPSTSNACPGPVLPTPTLPVFSTVRIFEEVAIVSNALPAAAVVVAIITAPVVEATKMGVLVEMSSKPVGVEVPMPTLPVRTTVALLIVVVPVVAPIVFVVPKRAISTLVQYASSAYRITLDPPPEIIIAPPL